MNVLLRCTHTHIKQHLFTILCRALRLTVLTSAEFCDERILTQTKIHCTWKYFCTIQVQHHPQIDCVLGKYGVPGPLLQAVQSLYIWTKSCVCILSIKSRSFDVGVWLHQGCLSFPLFSWAGCQGAAEIRRAVRFVVGGRYFCWLQMMLSFPLLFSFQHSVKWLGCRSASQSLSP